MRFLILDHPHTCTCTSRSGHHYVSTSEPARCDDCLGTISDFLPKGVPMNAREGDAISMPATHPSSTSEVTTMALLTGYAALAALRECDRLIISGNVAGRNALLLTVDPSMRNGREVV